MLDLKEEQFFEIIKEGSTVVDFWAPWCAPCRAVSPVLEQLSGEMKEVKFVKINVDENAHLAQLYDIRSIPTVVLIKDGHIAGKAIGAQSKESYKALIGDVA
jgi:thioredoxin 1